MIPFALVIRRGMPETRGAAPAASAPRPTTRLASELRLIVLGVLVVLGGTITTYVGIYMTTYGIAILKLPPTTALAATLVGGLSHFGAGLFGGWLSDRYGRLPVMLIPRIILTLLAYPLFLLIQIHPSGATLFLATAVMTALTVSSAAATLAALAELLPGMIRATGFAIIYAVGVALFGGTTQFVITSLIAITGNPTAPGWYVTGASIITLIATWMLPESRHRALET